MMLQDLRSFNSHTGLLNETDVMRSPIIWIAALALLLDFLYFVFAILMSRMWYEQHPTSKEILSDLFYYYVLYWTLAFATLYVAGEQHSVSGSDFDSVVANVMIVVSCLSILIATYFKMKWTRQKVVEGGYAPPALKLGMTELSGQNGNDSHAPLIVVITGANTGIGKATAQQLCEILSSREPGNVSHSKAIILLLCRNLQKGQEAIVDIKRQASKRSQALIHQCQMQVIQCDLCSFSSIRQAVQDIVDVASAACEIADIVETESRKSVSPPVIHSLINNAGVMLYDLSYTIDQHETCLQANFLGHFLLTSLLLPYISTSVLNVTSSTYRLTDTSSSLFNVKNFGDFVQCKNGLRRYTLFGQYALTKWFNILHTIYLAKKYPNIFSAAIHPGIVRTDVVRNMPWYLRPAAVSALILSTLQKTPAQGAWNTVHVWFLACRWHQETYKSSSSNGDETLRQYNGQYWVNRRRQALVQSPSSSDHISLEQQAQILWQWAVEQVALTDSEVEQMTSLQTKTVDGSTTTVNNHSKRE